MIIIIKQSKFDELMAEFKRVMQSSESYPDGRRLARLIEEATGSES